MELPEKIKFIRSLKGWTQENMAEQLGISTYAYAKIERGETDVNFSRLQQIAEVMGIELPQLLNLDDKIVFSGTHNTQGYNWYLNSSPIEQVKYKHELEKAQLIIEHQTKEINELKQQICDFREMVNLLKKTE